MALGINQITALAGQFLGLLAGGLLAAIDWRAVFWVSVPIGIVGTIWSYRSLREVGAPQPGRIDWLGNLTFAVGAGHAARRDHLRDPALRRPRDRLDQPAACSAGSAAACCCWSRSASIETRVAEPMFQLGLFRIRAFAAGNLAALLDLDRPRRHAVHADHLAAGHLAAAARLRLRAHAAVGGHLHAAADRRVPASPARCRATCRTGSAPGCSPPAAWCWSAAAFVGLLALPVGLPLPGCSPRCCSLSGIGQGMFSAPEHLGDHGQRAARSSAASRPGMRSTFQNSGTALSIGVFFSLMIAGLARSLPHTLSAGLRAQGVPAADGDAASPSCRRSARCSRRSWATTRSAISSARTACSNTLPAQNQQTLTGNGVLPRTGLRAVPPRPGTRLHRRRRRWRRSPRWAPRCAATVMSTLRRNDDRRDQGRDRHDQGPRRRRDRGVPRPAAGRRRRAAAWW